MFLPLFSGGFDANAFIVSAGKTGVIDAGTDPKRVIASLKEYSITPSFFINTHCHFDHVGGLPELVSKYPDAVVVMHELDAEAVAECDDSRILSRMFNTPPPVFEVGRVVSDGDVIDLGGAKLRVIHTPGHTPGGICLFEQESGRLFTGDTVFSEGVGRTDFTGGSSQQLRVSLEKLVGFCEKNRVGEIYPGHGPAGISGDIKRALQYFF